MEHLQISKLSSLTSVAPKSLHVQNFEKLSPPNPSRPHPARPQSPCLAATTFPKAFKNGSKESSSSKNLAWMLNARKKLWKV